MSSFCEITLLKVLKSGEDFAHPIEVSMNQITYTLNPSSSLIVKVDDPEETIKIGTNFPAPAHHSISALQGRKKTIISLAEAIEIHLSLSETAVSSSLSIVTENKKILDPIVQQVFPEDPGKIEHSETIKELIDASDSKERTYAGIIGDANSQIKVLEEQAQKINQEKKSMRAKLQKEEKLQQKLKEKLLKLQVQKSAESDVQKFEPVDLSFAEDSFTSKRTEDFESKIEEYKQVLGKLQADRSELIEENLKLRKPKVEPENDIELKRIHSTNSQLKFQSNLLSSEVQELEASLESSQQELNETNAQISSFQELIASYNSAILSSKNKILSLEEDLRLAEKEPISLSIEETRNSEESTELLDVSEYEKTIEKLREEISNKNSNSTEIRKKFQEQLFDTRSENSSLKSQYKDLREELDQNQSKIETLEKEIGELLTQKNSLSSKTQISQDLVLQLNLIKSSLALSDSRNNALREELSELSCILKTFSQSSYALSSEKSAISTKIADKEAEINNLKRIVSKYKASHPNYVPVKNDPVDQALADFINNLDEPLDVQFKREEPGIYFYGNKKVFVKIESNKIILRIGGGYMRIEEFIRLFTYEKLYKLDTYEFEEKKEERPSHKEERLTHKEERLTHKEERLTHKEERLTHKEERLTHKEERLSQKDERLSQKSERLTQKEGRLLVKEERLPQKEERPSLRSSFTMRENSRIPLTKRGFTPKNQASPKNPFERPSII